MEKKLREIFDKLLENRMRRAVALVLAIIVTFTTTYTLVLPAITLEKDTAETMSGVSLGGNEQDGDTSTSTESEDSDDSGLDDSNNETVAFDAEAKNEDGETEALVHVEADIDTFPAGTTMEATVVTDQGVIDSIAEAAEGEVVAVRAVDLKFTDENGETVQAAEGSQVSVTLSPGEGSASDARKDENVSASADQKEESKEEEASDDQTTETTVVQYTEENGVEQIETSDDVSLQVEPETDLDTDNAVSFDMGEQTSDQQSNTFAIVETVPEDSVKDNDLTKAAEEPETENPAAAGGGAGPEAEEVVTEEQATPLEEELPEEEEVLTEELPLEVPPAGEEGVLIAEDDAYLITMTYGPEAKIPEGASLEVKEILSEEAAYEEHLDATQNALNEAAQNAAAEEDGIYAGPDKEEEPRFFGARSLMEDPDAFDRQKAETEAAPAAPEPEIVYARFFDITILDAEGEEFTPSAPVTVSIKLLDTERQDEQAIQNADAAQVIHFGEEKTEVMAAEALEDAVAGVTFDTDSFSVYGVVYTVDFHFGEYAYSLSGGDSISLRELSEVLQLDADADTFAERIQSVAFSNPEIASVDLETGCITILIDEEDHGGEQGTLTITMKDGSTFTIDITVTGQMIVDADGIATIRSASGIYLPDEAEGNAVVLTDEESSQAVASVKEVTNLSDESQDDTVQYQVFDISLDGVDASDYKDGFKVQVNLPNNIIGRDFHLHHIHEGKTEEIGLTTVSRSVGENGLEAVSGFEFVTDGFSEFVLSYTVEYSYANYNYVIPIGESVALQSVFDFIRYTMPEGVTVENVEFSGNPTDPNQAKIITITNEGETWSLTANTNFSGDETLTVTFSDGTTLTIAMYCEQTHIDTGYSYILYTEESDGIHVLKADGTTEVFSSLDALEKNRLGPEYQWSFYFVYTQYDQGSEHLDYVYYFIRPLEDKSKSIALNHPGADLVQTGTNNIAVLPQGNAGEGGFVFHGYNNVVLGLDGDGSFAGVTGNGSTIRIWQQDPLPTYQFTVISDDYRMGYVTTAGQELTKQATVEQRQQDGSYIEVTGNVTYYLAETNAAKKNNAVITATPASHTNNQNQNKWEFDYWDLDGEVLYQKNGNGNVMLDDEDNPIPLGPSIIANSLEIPRNGSVLTAHFKQNSDYVVPNAEKEGTTISSMAAWLNELKNRNVPLNADGCNKTAEVYDYENRIYRVDLTAQSSLTTFDGTIDLGFIIDVSGSMNFPSYLYDSTDVTGIRDLSHINDKDWWGDDTTAGEDWGLHKNHIYYIIADPDGTATVCYLYYDQNKWWLCDASKDRNNGNGRFDPANGISADNTQYYGSSYYKTTNYVIMEAGDRVTQEDLQDPQKAALLNKHGIGIGDPKTRAFYLELSINNTINELNEILNVLSIANDNSNDPDVKIAWNTFRNYLPNGSGQIQHNFVSAKDNSLNLSYDKNTYGGGTSTDAALLDAAGVDRNDINNRYSDNDRKNWDTDNNVSHSYTQNPSSGFQWEQSATKYAVLITDGAPQRGGKSITSRYVEEAAQQLKNRGVNLVTVGLGIDNVTSGKILLYDIANTINNEKLFYSAKSGDELEDVLLQIIRTIMINATVQGNVTDTINEAFYPVDKETGKPLEDGQMIDLQGNLTTDVSQPHGIITYESINVGTEANPIMKDRYGVNWTTQDFTWEGWRGSVYVKAKEDLLGGNAVKTNTGSASIVANAYKTSENGTSIPLSDKQYINNDPSQGEDPHYIRTASLPSPRVNVNELGFLWNDTEWTVYLGTEVDPLQQLKELWNSILVTEVVKDGRALDSDEDGLPDQGITAEGNNNWYLLSPDSIVDDREGEGTGDKQTFPMADLIKKLAEKGSYDWWDYTNRTPNWDTFLTRAMSSDGIMIPYHEYGLNDDSNITITLTKVIDEGEKYYDSANKDVTLEQGPHATKITGDGVEKYTLTVLYSPDYTVLPEGQDGSSTEDFHTGIYGTTYQGHAAGTETSTNTHIINVFKLQLTKKNMDLTQELSGAVFKLYRRAADDETGTAIPAIGEGSFVEAGTFTPDGAVHTLAITSPSADGIYYLVEVTAPSGYSELPKALELNLADIFTNLNGGQLAARPDDAPYNWRQNLTITSDDPTLLNYIQSDEDAAAGILAYDVRNNPGFELPSTGGSGTDRLYLLGMMLTGIAGVGLVMRKNQREST